MKKVKGDIEEYNGRDRIPYVGVSGSFRVAVREREMEIVEERLTKPETGPLSKPLSRVTYGSVVNLPSISSSRELFLLSTTPDKEGRPRVVHLLSGAIWTLDADNGWDTEAVVRDDVVLTYRHLLED